MDTQADTGFLEALGSSAPVPGGGGASAYGGALAAALCSMVGNLTAGKAAYEDVEEEVMGCLGRLSLLTARLLALIEEDAEAFLPLARAYGMPKTTEEERVAKKAALQAALLGACEVPLAIMGACLDVLHECDFLAHHGSKLAISDVGAAALFAKASLFSASLNVYINLSSMADAERSGAYREQADGMIEDGRRLADSITDLVGKRIEAPDLR